MKKKRKQKSVWLDVILNGKLVKINGKGKVKRV